MQLLQLRHGVPGARTLGALDTLVEEGHLPIEEADVLAEAYRFCERTRNRSFLVVGAGDSLPLRPEQATPLARSLGFTVAGLRAEYRRVTRRARRIVERRFYDRVRPDGLREDDGACDRGVDVEGAIVPLHPQVKVMLDAMAAAGGAPLEEMDPVDAVGSCSGSSTTSTSRRGDRPASRTAWCRARR